MIDRSDLRALVLARRDCQAEIAAARLALLDAEAAGLDLDAPRAALAVLEGRDAELAYAQRQLAAEIALAEAAEAGEAPTPLGAG